MGDVLLTIPRFPRLDELLGPLLIWPVAADRLLRRLASEDLFAHVQAASLHKSPPLAVSRLGGPAGRAVAVIPLVGLLAKQRSSAGGTSTIDARRALRQAAADPEVGGIVLAIDSPGGTAAGTADLAAEVREARRSKPVISQVQDTMASAAVWVGSQASEVWANQPTALVGSVGTVLYARDSKARSERLGDAERVFSTGKLKAFGDDAGIDDDQAAELKGIVHGIQSQFDAELRKGRGMSAAQLAEVKSGAVYTAERAKELKLVDGVRSLEQTIAAVAAATR